MLLSLSFPDTAIDAKGTAFELIIPAESTFSCIFSYITTLLEFGILLFSLGVSIIGLIIFLELLLFRSSFVWI